MKTEGLLRFDYASIKKKYQKIGKGSVRLTQSTLFLLQEISPTKAAYSFPVLENDNSNGGVSPFEIRLNQNDEFVATSMGMYLAARAYTGTPDAPVFSGGLKLLTYVPLEMNGALDSVTPVYDGYIRIGVNNIIYVDKWATRKHELVQRTEFNNRAAVALNGSTIPSFAGDSDGLIVAAPTVTLSGAKKNEISLILPTAADKGTVTLVDNGGTSTKYLIEYVALRMEGLLAQNAANFQTASKPARPTGVTYNKFGLH